MKQNRTNGLPNRRNKDGQHMPKPKPKPKPNPKPKSYKLSICDQVQKFQFMQSLQIQDVECSDSEALARCAAAFINTAIIRIQ